MSNNYAPPSPAKLPAFKAHRIPAQRPPSPDANPMTQDFNLILPMGCELTIHNITTTNELKTTKEVIEKALSDVTKAHPPLLECPVSYSFRLKDTPSVCTIKMRSDVASMDNTPRPDLLDMWIEPLRAYNLDWEVDWACASPNKDKRLWVSVKGIDGLTKENATETGKKVRLELEKMGILTVSSFFLASSAALVVNAASLRMANMLREKRTIRVPSIGPGILEIDSFQVIQPEWPYELAVTGLDNYDPTLSLSLDQFFIRNFLDKDSGNTLWHRSRVVDGVYIVMMKDWQATLVVLQAKSLFESFIQGNDQLMYPRQLYDLNTTGKWGGNISRQLKMATKAVGSEFDVLRREMDALRKEVRQGQQETANQFTQVFSNFKLLTSTVSSLHEQVQNQSYAMMTMRSQQIAAERRMMLESQQMRLKMELDLAEPEERDEIKRAMRDINKQMEELDKEKIEMSNSLRATLMPSIREPEQTNAMEVDTEGEEAPTPCPTPASNEQHPSISAGSQRLTPQPTQETMQEGRSTTAETRTKKTRSSLSAVRKKNTIMIPPASRLGGGKEVVVSSSVDEEMIIGSGQENMEAVSKQVNSRNIVINHVPFRSHAEWPKLKSMQVQEEFTVSPVDEDSCPGHYKGTAMKEIWKGIYTMYSSKAKCTTSKLHMFVLLFLVMLNLVSSCNAVSLIHTNGLSIYALNANGMVHPGKVAQVKSIIRMRQPHVVVISETKTYDKVGKNLPVDDYNFYEETGIKMDNHHLYKWGMVVGIRKDIQVARRIEISNSLKGRVVAVDVVLGTSKGKGFLHRVIGTYAPWKPGTDTGQNNFWTEMVKICNEAPHSWTLAGDVNATVLDTERASGGGDARRQFVRFLQLTKGHDIWSDRPERSRATDWTCRAHNNQTGNGNIIDRVVVSEKGLIEADISVANKAFDFVQMTDHRAVTAMVLLRGPDTLQGDVALSINMCGTEATQSERRVRYPSKRDKAKFADYRCKVDEKILEEKIQSGPISGGEHFTHRYEQLTRIIVETAKQVFGTSRRLENREMEKITSPKIRYLETYLKRLGGALHAEKRGDAARVSVEATDILAKLTREYNELNDAHSDKPAHLRQFITIKRKKTYKELYHARMDEIVLRAKTRDRKKMLWALQGGSTKSLVKGGEYIGLPTAVESPNHPGDIITDAQGVKKATAEYLSNLYKKSTPPEMEKPWMNTPSVCEVRKKVAAEPFQWPKITTLNDYRAMLRKGNQRPAPGPDAWEKWCVKNLSDNALTLVLELHNYIIQTSTFPGKIKEMTSTMFHKRNLRTDLANWRGIMLSNFIANSPMTWLTHQLTTYTSKMGITPETQVATQQGVQTRDVISYLASIKCYAQRHNQTIYALQRDQMKGFDYLAPQGFYDAIKAYGLPEQISKLDMAAQERTPVWVRTAYGLAGPIIIDAVTKQGGPASPLKSILTTSLGHRYLDDTARMDPGALVLQTSTMKGGKEPHTTDHKLTVRVTMAEATDDSIIFATNIESLQNFTMKMERFQYAYGWLTSWKKTVAYGLCIPEGAKPDTIQMPSITVKDGKYAEGEKTWHEVPIKYGELQFLRAKIDDPACRAGELQDFIKNFNFPKFSIRTPITLARKIIMQVIASKCRALLSIQPIKQKDAEALDRLICSKVHEIMGFPYQPNTNILTLPLEYLGSDFPSIARINAGIAVEGIMRDLNHHIKAYEKVAKITLADWTCQINKCETPIDGTGLKRDIRHLYGRIPATWLIAHGIMGSFNSCLNLRATDASLVKEGDVSITHMMNIAKRHGIKGMRSTSVATLERVGLRTLKDIGRWEETSGGKMQFVVKSMHGEGQRRWSTTARKNWAALKEIMGSAKMNWLYEGSDELTTPREQRRRYAESMIREVTKNLNMNPSRLPHNGKAWATDGSMTPATSGILDDKTVTAAVTGPKTLAMRLVGRNISIQHGEVMGLIAGHLLVTNQNKDAISSRNQVLYTDHMNTVRFIQDVKSKISQDAYLRYRNGRSYLRWLQDLVEQGTGPVVIYTKGHSDQRSLEARLNDEADHYATEAQRQKNRLPIAPVPTFYMNQYTFYREQDGWIESNIREYVEKMLAEKTAIDMTVKHRYRMNTSLFHKSAPPSFIYHKATSAYSATVQLYARCGQLPTAENMMNKMPEKDRNPYGIEVKCRLGCNEKETTNHIFTHCEIFQQWREDAGNQLEGAIRERLTGRDVTENEQMRFLYKAKCFYRDDPELWPLVESHYYLGHVPKIRPMLTSLEKENKILREKVIHGIYCDWHNTSVRLAGRIFGELQRRAARHWDTRRKHEVEGLEKA